MWEQAEALHLRATMFPSLEWATVRLIFNDQSQLEDVYPKQGEKPNKIGYRKFDPM